MVGKQIKKARLLAGLSQKQLGDLIGKGISTISEWESDKRSPDVEMLPILSKVLNVSQGFILGLTNDPNYIKTETSTIFAMKSTDVDLMIAYNNAEEWQRNAVRKILGLDDGQEN